MKKIVCFVLLAFLSMTKNAYSLDSLYILFPGQSENYVFKTNMVITYQSTVPMRIALYIEQSTLENSDFFIPKLLREEQTFTSGVRTFSVVPTNYTLDGLFRVSVIGTTPQNRTVITSSDVFTMRIDTKPRLSLQTTTNGLLKITARCLPWETYTLESTPDISNHTAWNGVQTFQTFDYTNEVDISVPYDPKRFWRLRQVTFPFAVINQ